MCAISHIALVDENGRVGMLFSAEFQQRNRLRMTGISTKIRHYDKFEG
jgi:hypothetical protein